MSVQRVLTEMAAAGIVATELGPDGFLPTGPQEKAAVLAAHGLRAVGGFVPVVLHDPMRNVMSTVTPALDALVAAGASTIVLSADSGLSDSAGYDERVELDGDGWKTLFANLDRIRDVAAERGITATLHPHVGTVIERPAEVDKVLTGSQIPLCLDTGHLLIGGTDPAALAADVPDRIAHTHLKDVQADLADRVRTGELTYSAAVRAGMYRPLGRGDVDIAAIVSGLQAHGYDGWYVMEQDTILDAEPAAGEGPNNDVRASLAFLAGIQA
jgi:inosose dehydratase